MHSPLIVEPQDPKWLHLQKVLAVVSTRRTKQELSKRGITPVASAEQAIKIALVAIIFSADIAFVVQEMRSRKKLRRFMGIQDVASADNIYRFFSKCDEAQFISVISGILNSNCTRRRKRGNTTFLIDAAAITLDLNWFRRTFSKKHLEKREFKWGYAPSHGHYIGYKLTLVIE
jgi:hypothetical protein